MSETLALNVVTPASSAFSGDVLMVEVPGEMGDFGVLPGHAPFMSMIRPGVVRVHVSDAEIDRFFITAGYAEVNPEGCTILAETLERMSDITVSEAEQHLDTAQKALNEAFSDIDKHRASMQVSIAEARVEAAKS